MLGSLMQHNDIDGVIVGADRIVKNGDTANKVCLTRITASISSTSHLPMFRCSPATTLRHVVL
jgi:methylthioribose-1-phosphate isomerase